MPHSSRLHHVVKAGDFAEAVVAPDFVASRHVLVISNPAKMPGFSTKLSFNTLRKDTAAEEILLSYPGTIKLRYHDNDWKETVESVVPQEVDAQFFRDSKRQHWNAIDCDARVQPRKTGFNLPTALKEVSLNEIYRTKIAKTRHADKEANYLLVSSAGAITSFHQDFSGTSVLYFLMKGCKTFYLVPPTVNNQALFEAYSDYPREDIFFGSHPDLDGGGCQKVTITERQAVCMPANMIHFVETTGSSVALGLLPLNDIWPVRRMCKTGMCEN